MAGRTPARLAEFRKFISYKEKTIFNEHPVASILFYFREDMVRAGGRGGRKSAAVKYTEDPDSGSDDEVMQVGKLEVRQSIQRWNLGFRFIAQNFPSPGI